MPVRIEHSSLDRLEAGLSESGAGIGAIIAAEVAGASQSLADAAAEAIREVTPVRQDTGHENPYFPDPPPPGGLRDSTEPLARADGLSALITVQQTAKSPDDGSRWGDYPIWKFVYYGHDGTITPKNGKRALSGPRFGPVASAGPAAGQPYLDDAIPAIDAALGIAGQRIGEGVAEALRKAL